VSTTSGLPGWEVSIAGVPQSTIYYNDGTLGDSSVAILGKGNSVSAVIDGNFSVVLTGGAYLGNPPLPADAAISQTGLVPPDAKSILFASYSRGNGFPNLSVMLNGQSLDLTLVSTTSNYLLYGADVSPLAGKSANLTIVARSNYPLGFGVFGLDDISFSPNPIPEPSVLCLFVAGLSILGWRSLSERRRFTVKFLLGRFSTRRGTATTSPDIARSSPHE